MQLSPACTDEVLRVVWQESRSLRGSLHAAARIRSCDVVLTGPTTRFGDRSGHPAGPLFACGGTCPCRDYVTHLVVEADRYLRTGAGVLRNPAAAVRVHLRTRGAGDWIRAVRVERGAQARTDRIRTGARARALPDEYHRALLEYLVDEAGSTAPLDGEGPLRARLADRAAREFGGTAERHVASVAAALPRIEDVCRSGRRTAVDGIPVTWWERYVEIPLGRRDRTPGAPVAGVEVPCPVAGDAFDAVVDTVAHGPGGADSAVLAAVAAAARTERPVPAVRAALAGLAGRGVLPAGTVAAVLADPGRTALVVALAARVGAGVRSGSEVRSGPEVHEPGPGEQVRGRERSVRPAPGARAGRRGHPGQRVPVRIECPGTRPAHRLGRRGVGREVAPARRVVDPDAGVTPAGRGRTGGNAIGRRTEPGDAGPGSPGGCRPRTGAVT